MRPDRACFFFDAPGIYRILVAGRLTAPWLDVFDNLRIRRSPLKTEPAVTTLTGMMTDQAALMGALTTLCDLGCALLEVKRLSAAAASKWMTSHADISQPAQPARAEPTIHSSD